MDAFKNFAISDVSAGYASGATSIVLATGGGAKFPAVPFNAVWWDTTYPDPSADPNVEVVRVTNVATDTLTITRAQEGTADANHNTGGRTYRLIAPLTALTLNAFATVATSGSASDLATGTLPIARIADGAVVLAKLADLAQDQFIGRTTASTGVPQSTTITAAARTVLDDASVSAMVDTLGGASATGTGGLARTTDPALTRPAITGTPAAAGAQGYDSASGQTTQYSGLTASVGSFPRVLAVGRPGGTLTNSTTADQDFSAIYTIPASVLVANKVLRVTLNLSLTSGVTSATLATYLKLGSTKLVTTGGPTNMADSLTRSGALQFHVMGTAAAGASVAVEGAGVGNTSFAAGIGFGQLNSIGQPVAGIATNGTLAITLGAAWSATGSTEVLTLLSYIVEELN